ncbi:MAG: hypothetical protein V2A58_13450 [Planctomycetota bacterium]
MFPLTVRFCGGVVLAVVLASVEVDAQGVTLLSPEGRAFVGNQLDGCSISRDGTITSSRDTYIQLLGTEGRAFILTGQVAFSGNPRSIHEGGVEWYLRETDGLHRYEVYGGGVRVKRRLLQGLPVPQFAWPVKFEKTVRGAWYPFVLQADSNGIRVSIGRQVGEVPGPLDGSGKNGIRLFGGRIRNPVLTVLGMTPQPALSLSMNKPMSPQEMEAEIQEADDLHRGRLELGFRFPDGSQNTLGLGTRGRALSSSFDASSKPEYLGRFRGNRYALDSTSNPYGPFGSRYSATSIRNPYSMFGSPYSSLSPSNPYTLSAPRLYGEDGTYLGRLSSNPYDAESISNPYGTYGSRYSPLSINNPYGTYGSQFSPLSPNNPYTITPPIILGGDE